MEDPRRHVPRTDAVLAEPAVADAAARLGRPRVKGVVAEVLQACREGALTPAAVVAEVLQRLPRSSTSLRPVLNATGVVVHTNLGRAPLSAAAVEALTLAAGTTDVELDLETGRRGPRGAAALEALRCAVPDAEDVHVVNNGAAAVALVARALAADREVLVARGELVEIGDGFRIPELVESLGVRLREVGTTNRVRLEDYAAAVGERTAFVLKVHPSNFRVEGFTSSVGVDRLASLGLPVVADLGSGLLAPHPRLPEEPDAASALRAGASLVTASGDKLLGGPQCGLVLGRGDLVHAVRRHPMARAVRVDKLTLAALEATLAGPPVPVAEALARRQPQLQERARRLAAELGGDVRVETTDGRVGGGGAPGVPLPSAALSLPAALALPLRRGDPPVVGRVRDGRLLFDLLTVPEAAEPTLLEAVRRARAGGGG
ncbi:L-seryl-tRNA(Sec) selenium transferase [Phycicoccus endophyticus]|uniref:L-seryl-tRNA(Sec) selenium transferase n=1 Tax=Phycicoccus endophyticus TaxID=1690220 RepID=A0A7G9QZY4_9MICO|nr:L-seryl-tRNA(Sec) selenium transferase [Phycicoccus endophyticus]NHI20763.1 L-seryl-tRNA(Sec) selenium transferase [Phycicoccus endophyticus]QNN48909.1 L-seryl-tRNA(Sec) selenium transferase [Phycicoccus endophyticus]GGL43745.1 L-seryl-tRNA(Sec) selenium transferase [Phycicoccus endophyticus]